MAKKLKKPFEKFLESYSNEIKVENHQNQKKKKTDIFKTIKIQSLNEVKVGNANQSKMRYWFNFQNMMKSLISSVFMESQQEIFICNDNQESSQSNLSCNSMILNFWNQFSVDISQILFR